MGGTGYCGVVCAIGSFGASFGVPVDTGGYELRPDHSAVAIFISECRMRGILRTFVPPPPNGTLTTL